MDEKITRLKEELEKELSNIQSLADLDKIRVAYLGKKGIQTSNVNSRAELQRF